MKTNNAAFPFAARYLDNGFYEISRAIASKLCSGKLPKHGFEKLVELSGRPNLYAVQRTVTWGKQVWAIRLTPFPVPSKSGL
jgi:hypothetical protein